MNCSTKLLLHKFALLFLFVLGCTSAYTQPCTLKTGQLTNAPELRGFRLGMTFPEVKTRVPKLRFGRTDEFGVSRTSISPSYEPDFDVAGFADVRTISLDFLDGNLTTLWIGY